MSRPLTRAELEAERQEYMRSSNPLNDRWRTCPWCERPWRKPGYSECSGCWSVMGHLDDFLSTPEGREYVRKALKKAKGSGHL